MITDLILLLFLLSLIGGILLFITRLPAPNPTPSSSKITPSSSSNQSTTNSTKPSTSSSFTNLTSTTSFDWNKAELKLKTNLKPKSQKDLLQAAQQRGQNGGRFVANHPESFRFGNKYP